MHSLVLLIQIINVINSSKTASTGVACPLDHSVPMVALTFRASPVPTPSAREMPYCQGPFRYMSRLLFQIVFNVLIGDRANVSPGLSQTMSEATLRYPPDQIRASQLPICRFPYRST